jgi:outer membrane protein OmpA-like peptidoglycan-associated protein
MNTATQRFDWPSLLALGMLCGQAACASAPPPQELVDARAAYTRSESGRARQYDPAGLHEAKVLLDRAENAYVEDPGSSASADLAYVAMRRAQRADSEAAFTETQQRLTQAQEAGVQRQAKVVAKTQSELANTRQQLTLERKARIDAEARVKETLNQLVLAHAAAVKEEPRGTVITLSGGALFASNKSELLASAQTNLDQIATALRDQPEKRILIEGHTDSRGTASSNVALSKSRADAVATYLSARGVEAARITSAGIGAARPIASNESADGRADNRRVEIVIQPNDAR